MNSFDQTLLILGLSCALAACGGGGSTEPPPSEPPPESESPPDSPPPDGDGPGTLQFAAPNYQTYENDGTSGWVLVTRSGGSDGIVTANVRITPGTATAPDDYQPDDIEVRFGDGDSAPRLIALDVVSDSLDEPDETLVLTLHDIEGCAELGEQDQTEVTIVDDDDPASGQIAFSADAYDVAETIGSAAITLERLGGDFGEIAVVVSAADGTADEDDYAAVDVVVVFDDGETDPRTAMVPIRDDLAAEPDETILLSLTAQNPEQAAAIGLPEAATLTILDDDQPNAGRLHFSPISHLVDEAAGSLEVDVIRSDGASGAVSVEATSSDGTASAGSDYQALTTTVEFADGESGARSVELTVLDDADDEADETLTLTLSNPTGGASLGTPEVIQVGLVDDDGGPPAPPAAPALVLDGAFKALVFEWESVAGATHYRLMLDPTGSDGFTQVGDDLAGQTTAHRLTAAAHLLDWNNALFLLQACNSGGCTDSNIVAALDVALAVIGYVKASNTEGNEQRLADGGDRFGHSVAVSGDGGTLAVAADDEDSSATLVGGDQVDNEVRDAGAVYLFAGDEHGWGQQAYVKAPNPDENDRFGTAIALSADGNTLVVGAPHEASDAVGVDGDWTNNDRSDAGAVYVYARTGAVWMLHSYLKASNAGTPDSFGAALSISADGNTLAVGAPHESSAATEVDGDQSNNDEQSAGAAYVFVRSGDTWSQQAYLKASNTGRFDNFGSALALSGDGATLAVGAPGEDNGGDGVGAPDTSFASGAGAVYVFTRSGADWSPQGYLKASNSDAGDAFGTALALSDTGSLLLVGAPFEDGAGQGVNAANESDNSSEDAGAAYLFARSSGAWAQAAYLKASNTTPGLYGYFGASVSLSGAGDNLAVGARSEAGAAIGIGGEQTPQASHQSAGAAYVLVDDGNGWAQRSYVKAINTDPDDWFGFSIALSRDGGSLVVGAPQEDSIATGIGGDHSDDSAGGSGAVYVY